MVSELNSWNVAWVVTPGPLCVPFPRSQVFLYRMGLDMDIVTWKVIVSMDLGIRSELRIRWQNETFGSVAFYSDWGFFCFMVELNAKIIQKHFRRNTLCAPGWPIANVRRKKAIK